MIRIGKIVATHGLSGTLIMTHIATNNEWLKKGNVLMVEMQKGSFIPYFVTQCKAINSGEYHVNVEDVSTQQEAKRLVTRHVYVAEELLEGMARQSPLLWIGFTVLDKHYGDIGKIEDVMQTGKQWIATLNYNNSEVLIPLVDATIESLDLKARVLKTTLPEGLLEVYQTQK
ncbi:MAG: ribosome maturation factor RimM [Taibaiella sp.]|nr:ribosome maturation factor RimM [Taibaiella sp.]